MGRWNVLCCKVLACLGKASDHPRDGADASSRSSSLMGLRPKLIGNNHPPQKSKSRKEGDCCCPLGQDEKKKKPAKKSAVVRASMLSFLAFKFP